MTTISVFHTKRVYSREGKSRSSAAAFVLSSRCSVAWQRIFQGRNGKDDSECLRDNESPFQREYLEGKRIDVGEASQRARGIKDRKSRIPGTGVATSMLYLTCSID